MEAVHSNRMGGTRSPGTSQVKHSRPRPVPRAFMKETLFMHLSLCSKCGPQTNSLDIPWER